MLTRNEFKKYAMTLYEFCKYPAVKYKILFSLLDEPYEDESLCILRNEFLYSDIVEELFHEQNPSGDWGRLQSKDYTVKAKFPTSTVAIERCLYIGLTLEDREILQGAQNYLEALLQGTSREKLHHKNERDLPWQTANICKMIEAIKPYNELCDRTYQEWMYIASRAFESGEYSYERERAAQHEVFWTKENRLIPLQSGLLLKRRNEVPSSLEEAMLHHQGEHAFHHGHFWNNSPAKLPESVVHNKTRRWFYAFNYINQFKGSAFYLKNSVDWLLANQNNDGLWDYGPQTKDPWGYFGYFSCNRQFAHNRVVDCTMEVLCFLKKYIDQNEKIILQ